MEFPKPQSQYEGLSKRAVEILRLLAEGLSDREIAERLVVTINTVKWYNRHIYSILSVSSRTQAIAYARDHNLLNLHEETKPSDKPATLTTKHNLPHETTHFIGREREVANIKRLLQTAHLLTLTGPPGTGKTRLCLRVAYELLGEFANGVYCVMLAPLTDAALVTNAIAAALGLSEAANQPMIETVKNHLSHQSLLLVLDNFEHVLSASSVVSDLLAATGVTMLVTSREVLHVYGEQEYVVPPLALPEVTSDLLTDLEQNESIKLFVQQARTVKPDFQLTEKNALEVAKICVRLDGLPLAIELAAARIKLLTPQVLLARLSSRLDTLTGGAHNLATRQQTLRNTIEWSYNLLDENEKILFARLAVFRGGRSLEAIEAVCGPDYPIDVLDGLASLVNKNLVQEIELPDGEPRFVVLETLHEYAWEQLKISGETEAMQRRHAEYFVALAERAQPELRLAQQKYWSELLKLELDNLRAVLEWSLNAGDVTQGIKLAGALWLFWFAFGHHAEGRRWTEALLQRLDEAPIMHHANFLMGAGNMATLYDIDLANRLFTRALRIARQLGDKQQTAWALTFLGYAMLVETEAALATADEGLALFRELDYKPGIAQALNIIGEVARFGGKDDRAKPAYEECLIISQETGETRRLRFMYGNLAFIAQHEGDYPRARELAYSGLQLACDMNNRLDMTESLAGIAGALGGGGQPQQAARLFGAWQAALEQLGAYAQPADQQEHDRNIAILRAQLDETTFQIAWQKGRRMSLDQAVAYALELKQT